MPRNKRRNRKNGKNSKRRSGGGRSYRREIQVKPNLYKSISLIRLPVSRKINYAIPVYAVYNYSGSISLFSLSSSTSQITPVLYTNLITSMLSNAEFTSMMKVYNLFKIDAVSLTANPVLNTGANISELAPLFLDVAMGPVSNINSNSVAFSDSSTEVKLNSYDAQRPAVTYTFPPVLQGSSGYPIGGTACWMPMRDFSSAANLNFCFGYQFTPVFTSLSGAQSYKVLIVQVYFHCIFASPDYTDNV